MESQIIEKAVFYAFVFVLGFVAVSFVAFWLVVRPPRIEIAGTPERYRLPAENVTIETADGVALAGWFIPRADGRADVPAVILLHGYPAEKADMLEIAAALHPQFVTLLLDLRYFGKSEGRATTLGLRERDDLKAAVDFLEARGAASVGVFGFSLGGAVGILAAAEDERIRAVAAYAPFSDLRNLGHEAYGRLWLLKYPLVELMIFWAELFFGGDVVSPSPADAASELSVPALLVASREDEQISFRHAERLRVALEQNPRAEFYFLEAGRHGELPPDFDARLAGFFERVLH